MVGTDSAAIAAEGEEAQTVSAKQVRERSSISFPYGDLDMAVKVVRTLHEHAGVQCTYDQLAGWLRQSPKGGAFQSRLATTRTFGLIETTRGDIALTDLGQRIVDESRGCEARAEAFLRVPLYAAVHKKYEGYTLPPPAALKLEMENFGVPSKQTDKARQAFERSAQQAGFFESGPDRLIMPAFATPPETRPLNDVDAALLSHDKTGGGGGGGGGRGRGRCSAGTASVRARAIADAPEPETDWPVPDRAKWLQTAANIFDLIYEGEGDITIELAGAQRSPRPRDAE